MVTSGLHCFFVLCHPTRDEKREVGAQYVTSVRHVELQRCIDSDPGSIHFTHVVYVSQDNRPLYSCVYFNTFEYLLSDVPRSDQFSPILLKLATSFSHGRQTEMSRSSIFSQVETITLKILVRHEKCSLPVSFRGSKTSLALSSLINRCH